MNVAVCNSAVPVLQEVPPINKRANQFISPNIIIKMAGLSASYKADALP